MLLLSYIAGVLTDRLGFRAVVVTGSILVATATIVSSLMPTLAPMYFTYGILLGLGIGFSFLPAVG